MILKPETQQNHLNQSEPYDYARYCGLNNCPTDKLPDISAKPTLYSVYFLCGALIFLCVLSIILTLIFVDNISLLEDISNAEKRKPTINICKMINQEFKNLFKLTKNVDFYLLLPIGIYAGFELTFMWAEFNRVSLIDCFFFKLIILKI